MKYKLMTLNTQLAVPRIANIHYFEFTDEYKKVNDEHNFCELLYVDRGYVMVEAESFSGRVSNNQLIIHRPNEVHSLRCAEGIKPNVIIIGFECSADELRFFSKKPVNVLPKHKQMIAEIMKEGMNVYEPPYDVVTFEMKKRRNPVFGADQMLKNKMENFLITLIRDFGKNLTIVKPKNNEEKVLEAHRYILEHFKEKIQLEDLCFLFGTNKTTLCKNFKKIYGMTITNYINMLKEREARRLLEEGKYSITEISERLGFGSIHYFCRIFKEATGKSPKEYMRLYHEKK